MVFSSAAGGSDPPPLVLKSEAGEASEAAADAPPAAAAASASAAAAVAAADDRLLLRGLKKARRDRGCTAKERISKMPPCAAGKRSSIYRGVTRLPFLMMILMLRHRWTGRYEAHLWDKSTWNQNQNKKGKQGAYDDEEAAARAYDLAALKKHVDYLIKEAFLSSKEAFLSSTVSSRILVYELVILNLHMPASLTGKELLQVSDYSRDLEEMRMLSREDYLASLRSAYFLREVNACGSLYLYVSVICACWRRLLQTSRIKNPSPVCFQRGLPGGNCSFFLKGTSEDTATDSEYAAGFCLERKIDLTAYVRWWGPNKIRRAEAATKSSGESHGTSEEIGGELRTLEWPIQHTEPYQLPSLGIPRKGIGHSSAVSACSILSQSSAFKNLQQKASESQDGRQKNKIDYEKIVPKLTNVGGRERLAVASGLSDLPLQRTSYSFNPLLPSPPLTTTCITIDPVPDPTLWSSFIPQTGLALTPTSSARLVFNPVPKPSQNPPPQMAKKQRKDQLQKPPLMNSIPPLKEDNDDEEEAPIKVEASSDICTTLLQRYQKSSAPQHRHLCASAAAIRSILLEEGFPLTPPAYLAAAISSIEDSTSLDPDATSALSSFLSILLPHVPAESLTPHKANEVAAVLARLLRGLPLTAPAATLRSLVKTLGFVLPRCDVGDWDAVGLPLEILLRFSVDRRPKVRKCAQGFLEKVFMSFEPVVCKKASKLVASMFEQNMPLAVELSATRISNGSKKELPSKLKHMEVIHLLNTLKIIFPFLSKKVAFKLLPDLSKLLGTHFSALTRHILNILGVLFELREIPVSEVVNIIVSVASFVSNCGDNPVDTVMSASTLLKSSLDKLHELDQSAWIRNLPLVFRTIAGLLSSQDDSATQAMEILREMINLHIGSIISQTSGSQLNYDELDTLESTAIESVCNVFANLVSASGGISNEHILAVISDLFLKLGGLSSFFTKDIILKLADQVSVVHEQKQDMKHIQDCIGSAVISMGPDKILSLLPITFNAKKLSCSNVWLIPIFKKYIVGASLYFFLEHIMPLATSIQEACSGVKKSPVVRNLQSCVHDLVDLLPSFCRYPTDTPETVEPLVRLLAVLLKDPSKREIVSTALQELIKQNKEVIKANQDAKNSPMIPITSTSLSNKEGKEELRNVPSHYSKKTASKNIRHLASSCTDLLQALTDAFFNSPPENRAKLKDAIGCLASITKSSRVKQLFIASLEKIKSAGAASEHEKSESDIQVFLDMEQEGNAMEAEKEEAHRCLMIEYASTLIEGADEDFVNMVFDYIRPFLLSALVATWKTEDGVVTGEEAVWRMRMTDKGQRCMKGGEWCRNRRGCTSKSMRTRKRASDGIGQPEAYYSLTKIFREQPWFYLDRFDEVIDMLLGLKSPVDVASLRSRFMCFHFLLVHQLKNDLGKSNGKAFLVLNEIILTLKSVSSC
ncbi:hypothetical protein ACLOJK_015875 [Asimina triloba]